MVECAECGKPYPELTSVDRRIMVAEAKRVTVRGRGPAWAVAALPYAAPADGLGGVDEPKLVSSGPSANPPVAGQVAPNEQGDLLAPPVENSAPPRATTWRRAPSRWRQVAVLERGKRRGATVDGESFSVRSNALPDVLNGLPPEIEVLYLLGKAPAAHADYHEWTRVELPEGYTAAGHYFGRSPVFRFVRPNGKKLEVLPAEVWFGSDVPSVVDAINALTELDGEINKTFRDAHLLTTPAATGKRLLLASIPFGESWPCVSSEIAQLIQDTTGQGRIEFLEPKREVFDGVVELDGKLMYAHCAKRLFVGEGVWTDAPGVTDRDFKRRDGDLSFVPGRYLVNFTVPNNWHHIGLLGTWNDETGRWDYPEAPGQKASAWVDGCELLFAADNDWEFSVVESITFDRPRSSGPLDPWLSKLLRIEKTASPPVARMVRLIVITAIGALSQRSHEVEKSATLDQQSTVPIEYHPRPVGDRIYWSEPTPILNPEQSHPEWAAHVWARCRARMAAFAMRYERADLLGIGLDALWVNASDPSKFSESAEVGHLRKKAFIPGPLPAARSLDHLRSLRGNADA